LKKKTLPDQFSIGHPYARTTETFLTTRNICMGVRRGGPKRVRLLSATPLAVKIVCFSIKKNKKYYVFGHLLSKQYGFAPYP